MINWLFDWQVNGKIDWLIDTIWTAQQAANTKEQTKV